MSNVYDAQGNLVNNPGPGCGRYTDENSLTVDWFDTHPRPIEVVTPEVPEVAPIAEAALSAGVTTSSLPQTTVTA